MKVHISQAIKNFTYPKPDKFMSLIFDKLDQKYMTLALKQAKKAYELGEVPIGAIITSPDGKVLGQGYNKTESSNCQSRHAEVIAIEKACKKIGDWRLTDCSIYMTLEPCLMCFALIGLSRIKKLVYGAKSPLFGYHIDNLCSNGLYQKHIKEIYSGVCSDVITVLLKQFFKDKRKKGGKVRSS